jgi:hypothetical protein
MVGFAAVALLQGLRPLGCSRRLSIMRVRQVLAELFFFANPIWQLLSQRLSQHRHSMQELGELWDILYQTFVKQLREPWRHLLLCP